ncbi:hypothetical protein GRI62_10100 [Erythrobacter arachoides]|uniref:Uncharacterized protein n=1 Tax=Aurantiacibacter arachoides TaxID=1850444 RepID=A0A845A093_9SPHN|nr:hypothetical protein [Aurantiacibacter arachoides]MXO93951.1 hypothetical protein [Aurantiacibacter arachoides]GGD45326.1 hypothetical protein GCM10011411_01170 [Aurantiacibacter arachoides]
MSKQLAIAASASVLAMAAFVLCATPVRDASAGLGAHETGATIEAAAPAVDRMFPILSDLLF